MTLSDFYRFFFLGIASVLTIPELALLAVFTRHTISQGSIYTFEIMGLVTSSLTLLLLPVLIFGPKISPNSPMSLIIFEIPMLTVLSGLWLSFKVLQAKQQNEWYPIPKAYRNWKGVSGCQFLPKGQEPEAHWCNKLSSTSSLMTIVLVCIVMYTLFLLIIALLCQLSGTPVWTRTLNDVLYQKIPARQPQRPQVSASSCSQPPTYTLQLFGGRWKRGGKADILSETATVQDGSDYINFPATDDGPPPPYA